MNGQFHVPATGWLHALDMRVKLCMPLGVVVWCSGWGYWVFLAAMLVVMHVLLLRGMWGACGLCSARCARLWLSSCCCR